MSEVAGWGDRQRPHAIESGANLTVVSLVEIANLLGVEIRELFEKPEIRRRRPGRPKK